MRFDRIPLCRGGKPGSISEAAPVESDSSRTAVQAEAAPALEPVSNHIALHTEAAPALEPDSSHIALHTEAACLALIGQYMEHKVGIPAPPDLSRSRSCRKTARYYLPAIGNWGNSFAVAYLIITGIAKNMESNTFSSVNPINNCPITPHLSTIMERRQN